MKKAISATGPHQPLSIEEFTNDGRESIRNFLKVNQEFLDELNSCQTKQEQSLLFENILSNNSVFDGEVFLIHEDFHEFPERLDFIRCGVNYAVYPPYEPPVPPPLKFKRYIN